MNNYRSTIYHPRGTGRSARLKRLMLFVLVMAVFSMMATAVYKVEVSAALGDRVRVNDEVTVEMYDWSATWDANQNNAYVDLVTGIFNGQTTISVHDDYVTGRQLMNVVKRISEDFSVWEPVSFGSVSYTDDGYADTVTISYHDPNNIEGITSCLREVADYTAFGLSFVDPTMTDLEKALVLHDYIGQRTFYKTYTSPMGTATGVFTDHIGICENISTAYEHLLRAAHIPYGNAVGNGHAWTNIYIDGKWYVSDATFDSVTEEKQLKFSYPRHDYYLCGTEKHYETNIQSWFSAPELTGYKIEGVEYNNPTQYWDLSDCMSNVAYHVNAGESHGKWYYLTMGEGYGKHILNVRDSLSSSADVVSYPEHIYAALAWAHDVLYGYRDNSIYTIDWNTLQETRIGYLENNTYYMLGPDGSVIDTQAFDYDDVVGITGILAENGQLTARIAYADDTSEEIAAYTYDKTVAFSDAVKSPVSGPSDTSGEVLYSFNSSGPSIQDTQIAVSGFTDSFVHPDGYEFPDYQFGMILGSIREGAFKDAGPEQLGGHLKFGQFLTEIGAHAFENCTGISGDLDLTSVQETRDYAFYGCTGLDGKVILCPHRWVRKYAFAGCTGIRELENLETVNYIDEGGFKGCTALSGQYELCDWVVINDYAFMDCVNFDTTPVIKTQMIGESAFRNCAEMKGAKSLPKVGSIWSNAFMGSGVTRLEDLDALNTIRGDLLQETQIEGILEFPVLDDFYYHSFYYPGNITALRFPDPETHERNDNPYSFPETPDFAIFLARNSRIEPIIQDRWTYGVNYWYIDDVIASGELENGVLWSIGGDGLMTLSTGENVSENVVISGFDEADAPWDEYKKYVQYIHVEGPYITLGDAAICDFANLEKVNVDYGSTVVDGAFVRCDYLSTDNINIVTCDHEPEVIPGIEPTCYDNGLTEGQKCSKCGEILVAQEVIPYLGHDFQRAEGTDYPPTCTEPGKEKDWVCSRCNYLIGGDRIDPIGHDWDEGVVTQEPTCAEQGIRTYTCKNDPTHTRNERIEKLAHTEEDLPAVEPTCTEVGLTAGKRCSVCGEILEGCEEIPELGHDWGAWEVVSEATCTEPGEEQRVCSRDPSHVETRSIEATGHTEEVLPGKAATCTETGLTEGKKCSVCGEILVAQEEIPALGHDYHEVEGSTVAATCETAGKEADKQCSRCDSFIEGAAIGALGHDWGDWEVVSDATCTEPGEEQRVCSRDTEHVEKRAIDATGHTEEVIPGKAATCTETGLTDGTKCSVCGEILVAQEEIPALGHSEETLAGIPPTCVRTGLTEGKKCSVCGEILVAQEEIPALGHDYHEVEGSAVAATCETAGKEADKQCSRCDSFIEGAAIGALGHDWGDWEVVSDATCTEPGEEQRVCSRDTEHVEKRAIAATGHTEEVLPGKAATCTGTGLTEGKKCSVCGETLVAQEEIEALGHDYHEVEGSAVAATCETAGKNADKQCSRCDSLIEGAAIKALGHDWGAWDVVSEATCTEPGEEQRVCGRDPSHIEKRTIAATGHTEEVVPGKAATCIETGLTEGKKCSVCGEILVAQEEIAALGHDYHEVEGSAVAATCETAGKNADKQCSRCDSMIEGAVIAALGHDYHEVEGSAVAATCESAGKEADKQCSRCDSLIEGAAIKALGHDWGEWTTVKEATEDEEGLEERTCKRDPSHKDSRAIPKLNHTHNLVKTAAVSATCTTDGNIDYWTCSKCHKIYSDENGETEITAADTVIDATGHTEVVLPGKAATCIETGLTEGKKCSVCGEILVAQEEIDALGHDYHEVEGSAVAATCETSGKNADKQCSRCDSFIEGAVIAALGHDWGDWTTVKEATEDEEGLEERVCKRDPSHKESQTIPKLNHTHDLVKTAAVAATCTTDGNIEYWTCSKCHKIYSDENGETEITAADTVIDATGHTEVVLPGKAATCTETGLTEGKKCSICGEILVAQEEIAALGHDYHEVEGSAVAATCETAGKNADKQCSRCDLLIEGAVIKALGHDWGEWTTVKEATEDEEGLEERTCKRDPSHKESQTIPKLNHTHDLVKTAAVAATCTTDGNIEYWTCSKCHKIYSDENGETEITAADTVIDATGHKEEVIPGKAATCTETGLTEGKKCSVCGEILVAQEKIAALGHDYHEVEGSAVAATCEIAGKEADKKCSRCDSLIEGTVIAALGHDYHEVEGSAVAATCETAGKEADKKCSRCDSLIEGAAIKALGHDWGDWTTVKEATEDEEGLEERTCKRDSSHKESQTIPKLNHTHNLVKTPAVAATCTTDGNIEYWTCSKCHKIYSDENGTTEITAADTVISATGHIWNDEYTIDKGPTCTEAGSESIHCSVCGEKMPGSSHEVEALGHNYGEWTITKEATCTETGSKSRTCSRCGDTVTEEIPMAEHVWDEEFTVDAEPSCTLPGSKSKHCANCDAVTEVTEIPAFGHSFGEWEQLKPNTCEDAGIRQHICEYCGFTETENIDPAGHDWEDDYTIDLPATCLVDGSRSIHCKNCDAVMNSEVIPATGHSYGEWENIKEATCTDAGSRKRTCSNCEETFTEEIQALGHAWNEDYTVDTAATCQAEGVESIHCARCGETKADTERPIAKTAHTPGSAVVENKTDATCTAEGHYDEVVYCTVCEHEISRETKTIERKAHVLAKIDKVEPTSESVGYEAYWKCSACGKMYSDEAGTAEISEPVEIPALVHEHAYGDWVVTRKATTAAEGSREKVCATCGDKVVETIPKVAPVSGTVTIKNTIANSSKKTNDVIWDKSGVTGATNYEIHWRSKDGGKNGAWKSTTVGNTVRGVTTGLTIGGLYEIQVRPFKAETATTARVNGNWSGSVYRYFYTTQKIRLASTKKGYFTMSWAKDPKATSYQILYTTNANGSGAAQNLTGVAASKTSFTTNKFRNGTKFKSGQTIYVQIREVKTVGGINYIGNISCPVAVKIK